MDWRLVLWVVQRIGSGSGVRRVNLPLVVVYFVAVQACRFDRSNFLVMVVDRAGLGEIGHIDRHLLLRLRDCPRHPRVEVSFLCVGLLPEPLVLQGCMRKV